MKIKVIKCSVGGMNSDIVMFDEEFFEDNEFSWSENSDGFKFNGNDNCIVVEGIDGYERWVFVKE